MEKSKKKSHFPHAIIFLLLIALVMVILSWIIPAGYYLNDAGNVDTTQGAIVYDNAHFANTGVPAKLGPWKSITCMVSGFNAASHVVFIILTAFATISLLEQTGALDAVVASCVRLAEKRKSAGPIILVIFMFLLAFWGGTGTLSYEEIGAFTPIFLVLCLSLGYDPMVALATCVMSMGFGFASGYANPFTTGVADGITGLPMFSGSGFRIICLLVTVGFLAFYTLRYGTRIKKDPSKSITADMDFSSYKIDESRKQTRFTPVRICSALALLIIVALMFYRLKFKGGSFDDVTALFLSLMLILLFIRWLVPKLEGKDAPDVSVSPSQTMTDWFKGMGNATFPALTVGFGYGVSYIMAYGGIKDPIVHAMVGLLGQTNIYVGVIGMFIFQTLLNFLVPSGSGQAAIAMPLMAPIAQGIGLNLQSATLAFNFGDGYSNLLWPTSFGVLVPVLTGIPVGRYYKWFLKFFGYVCLILFALLIISVFLWQGVY